MDNTAGLLRGEVVEVGAVVRVRHWQWAIGALRQITDAAPLRSVRRVGWRFRDTGKRR